MFTLFRFCKFCIVGFSGIIVDFAITWIAREGLQWNKYVANSLGFVCAASSNYLFNRWWTFGSNDPAIARQFGMFVVVSLVGLALNNAIVYILHQTIKVNFYVAKLFATVLVTVWNYTANCWWTFAGIPLSI